MPSKWTRIINGLTITPAEQSLYFNLIHSIKYCSLCVLGVIFEQEEMPRWFTLKMALAEQNLNKWTNFPKQIYHPVFFRHIFKLKSLEFSLRYFQNLKKNIQTSIQPVLDTSYAKDSFLLWFRFNSKSKSWKLTSALTLPKNQKPLKLTEKKQLLEYKDFCQKLTEKSFLCSGSQKGTFFILLIFPTHAQPIFEDAHVAGQMGHN